jgi:acetyl esterase/lipase
MNRIPRVLVSCLCIAALTCTAAVKPDIEYGTAAGESLRLDASTPEGPGPFPIVILIHGGGWASGDKAKDFTDLFSPLTKNGFLWFSINYRLAPKYRWPACFEDVQTAIRWVKAHAPDYHGDPSKIALLGYSAGGQLATLAAVEAQPDTRAQLRSLSALDQLHPGLPPFLLVHGTADKSVPYPGSLNFQTALKKLNVPCDLITLPNAPHNILTWQAARPGYEMEVIHWLQKTLGNP